ncbi:MAG TPA: SDR family NAD(P)-dependent oxidoreductase [Gemmatimonadales bacterium]|nr:SDR family NAD(P)-dependent oxidoreductase [Gemmatimonadales bacterium]
MVVITGAGSGLGRALALAHARRGWTLALSDRDAASAEAVLEEARGLGGEGMALACDVRSEAEFAAYAEAVSARYGGIDRLINNAGVGSAGSVQETDLAHWEWMLDINVLGVVRGCRAFVPLLRAGGEMLNIASFAAIACAPGMAAYNAAKAAVVAISESLRGELDERGVHVAVACPEFFRSRICEGARVSELAQLQVMRKLVERARFSADDVAEDLLRALERRQFMIITQPHARWLYRLKRLAPNTFFTLLLGEIRRRTVRTAQRARA